MSLQLVRDVERVPITSVSGYPGNPRRGDVGAIAVSLQANGMYRPIVVQASTGFILAGNHTWQAAKSLGWEEIAATLIDVDDETAARIVLADNKIADLGSYDERALADLLSSLPDTAGTGYSEEDVSALIEALEAGGQIAGPSLSERFGVPPFTVLDARVSFWQNRRSAWTSVAGSCAIDPVLLELAVLWFSKPGAMVVDPLADGWDGGGLVARWHGRSWRAPAGSVKPDEPIRWQQTEAPSTLEAVTPIEEHAGVLVKREDLWSRGGARGAKARAAFEALSKPGVLGAISAGGRHSPQLERIAQMARELGLPARLHTSIGPETGETAVAAANGAELVRHNPGYMSVVRARAAEDAAAHPGWRFFPYGMECEEMIAQTARQAAALPADGWDRLVVPVGSGVTLSGILAGMAAAGIDKPVLGVKVGGEPAALDRNYPRWTSRATLVDAEVPYETAIENNQLGGVALDPHYEAKCLPFLRPGDLLWTVGIRESAAPRESDDGLPPGLPPMSSHYQQVIYGPLGADDAPADLLVTALPADFDDPDSSDALALAVGNMAEESMALVVVPELDVDHYAADRAGPMVRFMGRHGFAFYNDAILVHAAAPAVDRDAFARWRALAPAHSQVLVFLRGGAAGLGERLGPVAFGAPEDALDEAEAAGVAV